MRIKVELATVKKSKSAGELGISFFTHVLYLQLNMNF